MAASLSIEHVLGNEESFRIQRLMGKKNKPDKRLQLFKRSKTEQIIYTKKHIAYIFPLTSSGIAFMRERILISARLSEMVKDKKRR